MLSLGWHSLKNVTHWGPSLRLSQKPSYGPGNTELSLLNTQGCKQPLRELF